MPTSFTRTATLSRADLDTRLKAAGVKITRRSARRSSPRSPSAIQRPTFVPTPKAIQSPIPSLRDTESVPLPARCRPAVCRSATKTRRITTSLVDLVRDHCHAYFDKEVRPHWPDAWIDFSKTKVGYEIPINRHFYVYEAPRPLAEIEQDIKKLEGEILDMLKEVA